MKISRTLTLLSLILTHIFDFTLSGVPPRLLPNVVEVLQVVPAGKTAELNCPVGAPLKNLFVEWSKGQQIIDDTEINERVKVVKNRILKIHPVRLEDSGRYLCRAINGFGHVDANVTLTVISGSPGHPDPTTLELVGTSHKTGRKHHQDAPSFLSMASGHVTLYHRSVNSSLRLDCIAKGAPKPHIKWLKDGVHIEVSSGTQHRVGRSHHRNKKSLKFMSRWSLHLKRIQSQDSGNYTCIVFNDHGAIKATFVVKVTVPDNPKLTTFEAGYPINTTIQEGQSTVMQCRLKSQTRPHIWWLKLTSWQSVKRNGEATCFPESPTPTTNKCYTVLSSHNDNVEYENGVYIAKLHIESANMNDAGKYICMAASSNGYVHKGAFLVVVSGPSEAGLSRFWTYIRIPTFILLFMFVLLIILYGILHYCLSKQRSSSRCGLNPYEAANSKDFSEDSDESPSGKKSSDFWNYHEAGEEEQIRLPNDEAEREQEVVKAVKMKSNCLESHHSYSGNSLSAADENGSSSIFTESHSHVHHHKHIHYQKIPPEKTSGVA